MSTQTFTQEQVEALLLQQAQEQSEYDNSHLTLEGGWLSAIGNTGKMVNGLVCQSDKLAFHGSNMLISFAVAGDKLVTVGTAFAVSELQAPPSK